MAHPNSDTDTLLAFQPREGANVADDLKYLRMVSAAIVFLIIIIAQM